MSEAKKKFSIIEVEHEFIEVEHQFTKRINIKVQNKSEALGPQRGNTRNKGPTKKLI